MPAADRRLPGKSSSPELFEWRSERQKVNGIGSKVPPAAPIPPMVRKLRDILLQDDDFELGFGEEA